MADGLRAVVDIGSNSVRLVVYDGPIRAPIAIFNEKALCGLGRERAEDGRLDPTAVADAIATLKRFKHVLSAFDDPATHVIATAGVREASDGDAFMQAVGELGFNAKVISGAEEAALAALGVVSFEPRATGIAGDMGGGSLELIALNNGDIVEGLSLPVGPLNVLRACGEDRDKASDFIEEQLDGAPILKDSEFSTLYSVGGAWRAVARIHMRLRSYPLSVLHHYELSSVQAIAICDLISKQSRRSLEEIPGIPRRRLDTLPYAAMVLRSVLRRTGVRKVVVSSGGVREGLLYQDLPSATRLSDPLIEACRFYAKKLAPNPHYGEHVFSVIEPLIAAEDLNTSRRHYAACVLMDVGAYFHPDLRAQQAFDTALSAPLVGLSHEDRVWIALTLFRRHGGRAASLPNQRAIGLLSWDDHQSATRLGLALRFLTAFAPKIDGPLRGCRLDLQGEEIVFSAPRSAAPLMGETPRKRLAALAEAYEARHAERFTDCE